MPKRHQAASGNSLNSSQSKPALAAWSEETPEHAKLHDRNTGDGKIKSQAEGHILSEGENGASRENGPQIREEMIKDWKMKDRNAAVTKVKAAEETLEVDVVEGQGRGGSGCAIDTQSWTTPPRTEK